MLIDSHCHLTHEYYKDSLDKIVSEAVGFGVEKFITIGTSLEENKKVVELANTKDQVYGLIGIYPHENQDVSLSELKNYLEENLNLSKKIVGIGECGIDITNRDGARSLSDQEEIFEMQVSLAKKYNLPVTVHNRNGDESVLNILKKHSGPGLRGVIHCFDSNWDFAKKILDLGFYISFTNMITYPKKDTVLEVVRNVPDSMYLVETDAPYLPPQSMRGEINYPKYVKIVAEKVAQIKQKTFEETCELSYKNTCSLFNLC